MAGTGGMRWAGSAIVVALSCLGFLRVPATAEVVRHVRTTGTAAILGGDQALALQQARRRALRQAEEEGVGVLGGAASVVVDNTLVDDIIRTEAGGLVRDFSVVEHGEGPDKVYRVTVDAVVALDTLSATLEEMGLAALLVGRPSG